MNNPPAFPNVNIHTKEGIEVYGDSGMTLRDYFAAKAMQGMLSEPSLKAKPEEFASKSYELADAMLIQRNKS